MKKKIGIIGGMGPLATCDLFRKIIDATAAAKDQDNVRVLIDNDTNIPDRTAAIIADGQDPLPELVTCACGLKEQGAELLIMPCNTAHYFYEKIRTRVDMPFLNMIEETAKVVLHKGIKKVGLLATDGTVQAGVYKTVFDKYDIEIISPDAKGQKEVMGIIYDGVKAGNTAYDGTSFGRVMDDLLQAGAQVLILGCTELPVAFASYGFTQPALDPTAILAAAAVKAAGGPLKEEVEEKYFG